MTTTVPAKVFGTGEESYAPDACAVIALLRNEAGAEKVAHPLQKAEDGNLAILIHRVTFAELYYDTLRYSGKEIADVSMQNLQDLRIEIINFVNDEMVRLIGTFKTSFRASFADCFVLAPVTLHNATVATSDRHEFTPIEKSGELKFEWIR